MGSGRKGGRPPKVTREEIAEAALRLGLEHATVRNIADELGVTSVTIYRHFKTAEEIIDCTIKLMVDDIIESINDEGTFEETLRQAARKYFNLICENDVVVLRLLQGNIFPLESVACTDTLISYGVRRGLTAGEAFFALRCVLQAAAGCACTSISQRGTMIPGFNRALAEGLDSGVTGQLDHLNSALRDCTAETADPMEGVTVALLGLRAMFGDRMTSPASPPADETGDRRARSAIRARG